MRGIITLVIFSALSGCMSESVVLTSYGIAENEKIKTEVEDALITGEKHIIESWNLIEETAKIPKKAGIEFGISYSINAPIFRKTVVLEEVIVFPGSGLVNPESERSAKEDSETNGTYLSF